MNFVGVYAPEISSAAKPQMLVECKGADSAAVTVMWPAGNGEVSCWTMTGKLDLDTLTVDYTDGVHKTLLYGEDGKIASETGIYENGKGSLRFQADSNTVIWIDEQDHTADELVFAAFQYGNAPEARGSRFLQRLQRHGKGPAGELCPGYPPGLSGRELGLHRRPCPLPHLCQRHFQCRSGGLPDLHGRLHPLRNRPQRDGSGDLP